MGGTPRKRMQPRQNKYPTRIGDRTLNARHIIQEISLNIQ